MTSAGNGVVSVAVPGGSLAVELVTCAIEPVLARDGISSQRKPWNGLRAAGLMESASPARRHADA
jgi:hypothetical protein